MSDDLRSLAADLTATGPAVRPFARKALQVTARHMKDDWRASAARSGLESYAADITYETRETASSLVADIGPTIGDAGSFGFVEEGGERVESSPQHAARKALEENEPDFERGVELAVAAALRSVGL